MTLSVSRKLLLATLSALLAVLLLVAVGQQQIGKVFDGANAANINAVPSIILLDEMRRDFLLLRHAVARHVLVVEADKKQAIEAEIGGLLQQVRRALRRYGQDACQGQSCVASPQDGDLIANEQDLLARYESTLEPMLAASRKGAQGFAEARDMLFGNNLVSRELAEVIDKHMVLNAKIAGEAAQEAERLKERASLIQLSLGAAVLLLIAGINLYTLRGLLRQLGGEPAEAAQVAERLSQGDLAVEFSPRPGAEDSVLARLQMMVLSLRRLADRADAIGQGDLDQEVPLASERDRLGLAVKQMVSQLKAGRALGQRRMWLKDGYAQLAEALPREIDVQAVAEQGLSLVARYLHAGRGVLYTPAAAAGQLELLASFMYSERPRVGAQCALGEGAIGQVARERKPIILHQPQEELAPILSGTQSTAPAHTYTYPLLYESELIGVLELATLARLGETENEYLGNACATLASALYLAQQRHRVQQMLQDSEAAGRLLREQSDSLREANQRMEEQQQQLQQQTEELQQSNAQMEEQQQQLQQQTEELQQSNSQLEASQAQLEQQNRDLESARGALDERARELDQASRYKSEFLANMSHELRTPLNSIILLSKMASSEEDAPDSAELREWSAVIHRSGQELLRLINDVLDLSKVEAGRLELQPGLIASQDLCEELRALFEPVGADKGLGFVIEDQLRASFCSDPHLLGQVLRNLLSNAFKFCKQGQVTLRLQRQPGSDKPLRLTVQDTGIGIAKDKQALVFEAFAQADGSTSREYGGTGLGLTISQRLVQLLGGCIELHSELGQGSSFTLCLPDLALPPGQAAATPAPAAVLPAALPKPALPPQDDRQGLKPGEAVILLIDDDPVLGRALLTLNRGRGYKTLVAASGREGLALARQHLPRGILLDLGLPDMDGSQLLHQLKTDAALASTPVYIISGRDRDEALLREGALGYLQKPVSDEGLLRAEACLLEQVLPGQVGEQALLLVESGSLREAELRELLQGRAAQLQSLRWTQGMDVPALLAGQRFAAAVLDLAGISLDEALALCASLRAAQPQLALVFYTDSGLDSESEARLRRYSDSVIMKSAQAHRRLLGKIERFLSEAVAVPAAPAPALPAAQAPREAAGPASTELSGKRILVADDDPRNLFAIVAVLERQGARISTATNGRKALDHLATHEVDLLLLDIMMPEMDGYQTLSALRADARLAGLPVIVLTAKALPADREKILASGADDFIAKPVNYEQLIATLRRWSKGRSA
ncbi:signal transduction histidine kinase/DNA-binding response OmpR family regulator [Paucibacter oligotrophus]|uniref:histidine kinase n=1 Tax=Roseateles oligotrophus TaxID=1769250 RepID=A0A840L6H7_9BURK|nr:response regulator [Roseateles oligotrophus]MBB4842225.1 signal transduction histidine kinase/DNA-binding response OmpR family regulator [Roseateles oligotrophus]